MSTTVGVYDQIASFASRSSECPNNRPCPNGALGRKLDNNVTDAKELGLGEEGVLVDVLGRPMDPDPLYYEFLYLGVPMDLALVEAWKDTARSSFKVKLLDVLSTHPRRKWVRPLWAFLVDTFKPKLDDSDASLEKHTSKLGLVEDFASRKGSDESETVGDSLNKEAFDRSVAAFMFFREHPEVYEYTSEQHSRAVSVFLDILKSVVETEVPGPWQEIDQDLDSMTLNKILEQCKVALHARLLRNKQKAHCWQGGPLELRKKLLVLLKKAVETRHPLVARWLELMRASVLNLEEKIKEEKDP